MRASAFLVALALIAQGCGDPPPPPSPSEAEPEPTASSVDSAPEIDEILASADEAIARADELLAETYEVPDVPALPAWERHEAVDELTRRPVSILSVDSEEQFRLSFPYEGAQRARLVVREHPRFGTDVFIGVERGQIRCHAYDCRIDVVFDDGDPVRWTGNPPDSGTSTTVFLRRTERFLARLRRATTVRVAVTFYRNGSRTFTFPGFANAERASAAAAAD